MYFYKIAFFWIREVDFRFMKVELVRKTVEIELNHRTKLYNKKKENTQFTSNSSIAGRQGHTIRHNNQIFILCAKCQFVDITSRD